MRKSSCILSIVWGLTAFAAVFSTAFADYKAPAWNNLPFDPAQSVITVEERGQLATALADYARSLPQDTPDIDGLRGKAIALALRLDDQSKGAVVANAQFKRGNFTPPPGPSISKADLVKLLLLQVKKLDQGQDKDKAFSAYVLDFLAQLDPKNEDVIYQAELAQQKNPVQWAAVFQSGSVPSASPAVATTSGTSVPVASASQSSSSSSSSINLQSLRKDPCKINGLVVMTSGDNQLGGKVMEILTTVTPAGSSEASCDFSTSNVTDVTKTSKDEALRAVISRHPECKKGVKFTLSFDDKYTRKDGGSAGTAYAVSMLSILENVNIDPACAITGDITVEGKVRKVGGVPSKISGAKKDGCKYVGIPDSNSEDVGNLMVLESYRSLAGIQIFSLSTLDDALSLVRQDRPENLTRAIATFAEVQQALDKGMTLNNPDVSAKIDTVLKLAPNHLSAKYLHDKIAGTAPTALTPTAAMNAIFEAVSPTMGFCRTLTDEEKEKLGRRDYYVFNMRSEVYVNAQRQLQQLEKKIPSQVQNTYYALMNMESAVENFDREYHGVPHRSNVTRYLNQYSNDVPRQSRLKDVFKCYDALLSELTKLEYDKDYVESQIR